MRSLGDIIKDYYLRGDTFLSPHLDVEAIIDPHAQWDEHTLIGGEGYWGRELKLSKFTLEFFKESDTYINNIIILEAVSVYLDGKFIYENC